MMCARLCTCAPAAAQIWTDQRCYIRSWLDEIARPLSELYVAAVELAFAPALPRRVRFVSHAVREIRNRLPDYVDGPVRRRVDYEALATRIEGVWTTLGLNSTFDTDLHTEGPSRIPAPEIVVPRELLRVVGNLIEKHREGSKRATGKSERLFRAVIPEAGQLSASSWPVVAKWKRITDWFEAETHEPDRLTETVSDHELLQQFVEFESVLALLAQPFFEGLDDIDDLLEEANS